MTMRLRLRIVRLPCSGGSWPVLGCAFGLVYGAGMLLAGTIGGAVVTIKRVRALRYLADCKYISKGHQKAAMRLAN